MDTPAKVIWFSFGALATLLVMLLMRDRSGPHSMPQIPESTLSSRSPGKKPVTHPPQKVVSVVDEVSKEELPVSPRAVLHGDSKTGAGSEQTRDENGERLEARPKPVKVQAGKKEVLLVERSGEDAEPRGTMARVVATPRAPQRPRAGGRPRAPRSPRGTLEMDLGKLMVVT